MSAKTKIILDVEAAEKVRESMRAEIKRQFGGFIPKVVKETFENTLRMFPDIELTKEKTGAYLEPATVLLTSSARNSSCGTFSELIESYKRDYHTGEMGHRVTPLESKVWELTEDEYLKLVTNHDLPIEQRVEISEAWDKRPDAEKELIETMLNDDLTVKERLAAAYKYSDEVNPYAVEDAENELKTKLADENLNVLSKIDDVLNK